MVKSEATVQSEVMLAISQAGHSVWRSNAGTIRDQRGFVVKLFPKGFPDLVGFRSSDGKFFVIEVKNESGRLSKVQEVFAEFAESKPIIYGVARSGKQALDIIEVNS